MTVGILLCLICNAGNLDDIVKHETQQAIDRVKQENNRQEQKANILKRLKYDNAKKKELLQKAEEKLKVYLAEQESASSELMKALKVRKVEIDEIINDMRLMNPKHNIRELIDRDNPIIRETIRGN